jgi:hypothetical protein
MKFYYKKYNGTLRPVIEIRVKNKERSIRYEVLVDSGADICLFDSEIGKAIGIEIEKGKPREVMGVGGKYSLYYLHPVTIEVGGWSYESEAGFMPKVGSLAAPYGIVGQIGFFENFVVKFDLIKEEVELKQRS